MASDFETASSGLGKIYDALEALPQPGELLNPSQGWTFPAISPSHVAWMAQSIKNVIESAKSEGEDEEFEAILIDVAKTVEFISASVLPNLPGNIPAGLQAIAITMSALSAELSTLLVWKRPEKNALPSALVRRLHQVQREIDLLTPDKDKLEKNLRLISDATEAAEALPSTLQELRATQAEVREASSASAQMVGKIDELHRTAVEHVATSRRLADESAELLAKAAEAYRVTTTIGLAAAFDERARKLNSSVYVWVGGLALSLVTLLVIGWVRLEDMRDTFAATAFDPTRVWTQVALSVLSVGAPIWFAWLSTKQIGQRFRLAEDYAFKASVSKAYEGYRREARDLSGDFAQSLFSSALKRLDEPPLRLLDKPTPGSPIHEFLEGSLVQKLVDHGKELVPKISRKKPEPSDAET
ncbi:hypothetical protein M2311_003691 [Rhizobium leguminosarum]|uniref:hypothetical protein n=2 Tax=Rhizobium TaxID=379 RepID=UPI0014418CF4|nr:hypothetical protein [Rhizobium leguminosarum]MDH6273601.1 hypothetical protein [Rhizobium leguminosarum]NKK01046.1 hypothetical protein [Rhizobium leguminosarum bv. viciae]